MDDVQLDELSDDELRARLEARRIEQIDVLVARRDHPKTRAMLLTVLK